MLKSISVTESGGSCSSCRSRSRRFYSGRRWAGATKGLVAGILKNGFPRRITLTRRLRGSFLSFYFSLSLSLLPAVLSALCLHRGPFGRIFFGKRRETCAACPRRTIVLLRQITHLSGWRQNKGSRLAKNPARISRQTRLRLSIPQARSEMERFRIGFGLSSQFIQRESYLEK